MNAMYRNSILALVALALLTISNAVVVGQDSIEASDLRGKWYGDDGRTYTFAGISGNDLTLKIDGPETKARPDVGKSSDEGLVIEMVGPESISSSQYLGSFHSPSFQVSKNLNTVDRYQPRSIPLSVLEELLSDHESFSSRIDIRIIDKSRLEITRHVTSIKWRRQKLDAISEKRETETALLTRTMQAKQKKDTGDGQLQAGEKPKKANDNAKTGEPDTFVCYNGDRWVKVKKDTPCAKPAKKQLADMDRVIGGLRNLVAKQSDLNSEAAQSAKAEISRYRKEKAQLLEAIAGDAEEFREAKGKPETALDLTRTTSIEFEGGVREETRDDNGLVELVREYREKEDGGVRVSFERSVKQKYSNGRPAQVWESYYHPEGEELQAQIEIQYYDPEGNNLGKRNVIIWRDRPDLEAVKYKYWVWDKSENDWKPTDTPIVGFHNR